MSSVVILCHLTHSTHGWRRAWGGAEHDADPIVDIDVESLEGGLEFGADGASFAGFDDAAGFIHQGDVVINAHAGGQPWGSLALGDGVEPDAVFGMFGQVALGKELLGAARCALA